MLNALRSASPYCATRVVVQPDGCWTWTGPINIRGYGMYRGRGPFRYTEAHLVVFRLLVGPTPEGKQLDHTCHTADAQCTAGANCPHRRCVNPAHLEPVTKLENIMRGRSPHAINARKTHCDNGHEFGPENTYRHAGGRACRTCNRAAVARYKARRHPKAGAR